MTVGGVHAQWDAAREDLFQVSKTLRMRLDRVVVVSEAQGVVTLGFEREVDLDWVRDKPKVQAAIAEAWQRVGGEGQLKYQLAAPGAGTGADAGAHIDQPVERPAEGARLQQMGMEVFSDEIRPSDG